MNHLLIFIFSTTLILAESISGVGYGKTVKIAKKEALGDIISNIGGMVSSSFSSTKIISLGGNAISKKQSNISVIGSYPILRPKFSSPKMENGKYKIIATLDNRYSGNSYRNEMKTLQREILSILKNSKKRKNETKILMLESAVEKYNQFQKLSQVARLINIHNIPFLTITKSELEAKISDITISEYKSFVTTKQMKIQIKTDRKSTEFELYSFVKLFVKFSKVGYFYLVNHSINDNGESYSYLVELNPDEKGKNLFIRRISKNQINKWILVGEMEVSEPLGNEYIQVIAQRKTFRTLPKIEFDLMFGLYKLTEKSVIANLKDMRGMILKENLSSSFYKYKTIKNIFKLI